MHSTVYLISLGGLNCEEYKIDVYTKCELCDVQYQERREDITISLVSYAGVYESGIVSLL